MIDYLTLEQTAVLMNRLLINFTNVMNQYYNMFYSTTPMDITLELINDNGEIVSYTIPNRAKDFKKVLNGTGSPEGVTTGSKGYIYQDTTNGDLYIKNIGDDTNTGWVIILQKNYFLTNYFNKNAGSPEGVVTATKGAMCTDTANNRIYLKSTADGNTGWVEQISTAYLAAKEDEMVFSTESSTTPTITVADNTYYQCGEITSLSLTFPTGQFGCIVSFYTGATAPTLTGLTNVYWADEVPELATNSSYRMGFQYDGMNVKGTCVKFVLGA